MSVIIANYNDDDGLLITCTILTNVLLNKFMGIIIASRDVHERALEH